MIIAFNGGAGRNIHLVSASQPRKGSPEKDRSKVICIAREFKGALVRARPEPADEPEYEPPIGA